MVKNYYLFLNLILLYWINIKCETIDTKRIEELKKILDDNSGDKKLLTYSEYKEIENENSNFHTNKVLIKYKRKVEILIDKIKHFVHSALSQPIAEKSLMENFGENVKKLAKDRKNIEVINCKLFMIQLYMDNAEGTFIDLHSFIKEGKEKPFPWLKMIFNNSIVQNEEIDQLVNLKMISAHAQNKEQNKMEVKQIEKVLIEGAGPNGLYAAIEFFMSGMSITLVNDRIGYTRIRSINLYGRWFVRMNFFLTSKDREILAWYNAIVDEKKLNLITISIKKLEMMMHDRLESLMEFIKKWNLLPQSRLVLLYETEVKNIEHSDELGYFANLGLPKKAMNYQNFLKYKSDEFIQKYKYSPVLNINTGLNFNLLEEKFKELEKWIHKEKMTNIQRLMEIKYGREIKSTEEIILKENRKISPYQLATFEMKENGGEWMKLREYPKVKFDLLLCAGGINDRIRKDLLGVRILIEGRKQASATFIRNKFKYEFKEELLIFLGKQLDKNSLREQKIDEFIKSCKVLSIEFKEKYKNLSEMLHKNSIKSFIRIRQNSHYFELTPEITPDFWQFFEEIEKIKAKELSNVEKIQQFRNGILRKWFAAIFYTLLKMKKVKIDQTAQLNMDENGEPGDKFDLNKINFDRYDLSVFDVSIITAKMPVKLFSNVKEDILFKSPSTSIRTSTNIKHSAIVTAIGDANVNMDFFSGEAVSIEN